MGEETLSGGGVIEKSRKNRVRARREYLNSRVQIFVSEFLKEWCSVNFAGEKTLL
jgi:hypothetical protein